MDFKKPNEWDGLNAMEKKRLLYIKQKEILDSFRERNAITQAQYEKSLHDMSVKMGDSVVRYGL